MKQVPRTQQTLEEFQFLIDGLDLDDKILILRYLLNSILGQGVKISIDIDPEEGSQQDQEITMPQLARILRRKAEELRSTQEED